MILVNWVPSAIAGLEAFEAFRASSSAADSDGLSARLIGLTRQLAGMPLIGAEIPEYRDEAVRVLFAHPSRIIYRVWPDRIDIVASIRSSRRLPRGL